MAKAKNKNTIILILSAVLIIVAVIIAIAALSGDNSKSAKKPKESESESVSVNLEELATLNTPTTEPAKAFTASTGKYKIATKDDPLGLRLEPNTNSDRLIYVPKGHEVEVVAVWEDWGYVVYEKTGGWLSMNYLEPVGAKTSTPKTTADSTTSAQAN